MTSAKWERVWPLLPAVLAGLVAFVVAKLLGPASYPLPLPAATMTFGIVVAGFAATQRNMLLTMSGSEVLRFVQTTGYYQDVVNYLMDGVKAGLVVSSVSVCGFFLEQNGLLSAVWLAAMAGSVVLVLGVTARNEMLTSRLVRRFLSEQPGS